MDPAGPDSTFDSTPEDLVSPALEDLVNPAAVTSGERLIPASAPIEALIYPYPDPDLSFVCALHARFIPCRSCLRDETEGDYFTFDPDIVDMVRRYQHGQIDDISLIHDAALDLGILISSDIDHYNASRPTN